MIAGDAPTSSQYGLVTHTKAARPPSTVIANSVGAAPLALSSIDERTGRPLTRAVTKPTGSALHR